MEWIANQPVFFGNSNACNSCDDPDYPQLSDNTDTIQFQLRLDNCGASQLLEDFTEYPYNSWSIGDGWSIVDDLICHSGTSLIGMYVPVPVADFPTGYYQITVVVDSFNGVGGVDVKIGNIVDGSETIGTITGVGTWNFFAIIIPATNISFPNLLQFYPTVENVEICFSEISAYKILTNAIIAFYDSDGNYITQISYDEHTTNFVNFEDTMTVTFDWDDLDDPISNGCYYMCLLDPCENTGGQNYSAVITNPLFAGSSTGWSLGGSTYSDEAIEMTAGDTLDQGSIFNAYINQCVYIDVTFVTGILLVYFGGVLVSTITTPGVHKVCGTPNIDLGIVITCSTGTATIESVRPITVAANGATIPFPTSDCECNAQSNTFKLDNYANSCTMVVNACNNENGMGFVFGASGFNPRLRIEAKLNGMKYSAERSIYQDSLGTKKVTYFQGRKSKYFCVDLQPEYIHDFLRLLSGFDNFYLDNVLYFVEDDEYNVDVNSVHDNVGGSKTLVSARTQNVQNTNCSGTENDCSLA